MGSNPIGLTKTLANSTDYKWLQPENGAPSFMSTSCQLCGPGCRLHALDAIPYLLKYVVPALGAEGMRRPKSRAELFTGKPKVLHKNPTRDELEAATVAARYASSIHHCPENGRLATRVKPATRCPRHFSLQDAGNAMRAAIRAGRISRRWINGFPKHIWQKVGDVWYEGCTTVGNAGVYHGYPVDEHRVPREIR